MIDKQPEQPVPSPSDREALRFSSFLGFSSTEVMGYLLIIGLSHPYQVTQHHASPDDAAIHSLFILSLQLHHTIVRGVSVLTKVCLDHQIFAHVHELVISQTDPFDS